MTKLQKVGYAALAVGLVGIQNVAAIDFGRQRVESQITGATGTADTAIQRLVANVLMFLAILAVLYGIYGGFLIMTAGGDEEKVKKGRTIIFQVIIGLIVIFLANSIIQWVLEKILTQ